MAFARFRFAAALFRTFLRCAPARAATRSCALLGVVAVCGTAGCSAGPRSSAARQGPPVTVINAWVRATIPGATGTAAYMTLQNPASSPVVLVRAHSPAAEAVEFHESVRRDGIARMHPLPRVTVPARGVAKFVPGGAHIMLIGVRRELRAGSVVPMTLVFAGGDSLRLILKTRSPD